MSFLKRLSFAVCRGLLKGEADRFTTALTNVEKAQECKLSKLISDNKHTALGQHWNFCSCSSYSRYKNLVPITSYEDYLPWLNKLCCARDKIICASKIERFHLSSGSTTPSKLVPFTKTLRSEFYHGLAPWLYNLLTFHPKVSCGTNFWIVSPKNTDRETTFNGIPVSFDRDEHYFPPPLPQVLSLINKRKNILSDLAPLSDYKKQLTLSLLADPELSLISVWSPGYFILLLEEALLSRDFLCETLLRKLRGAHLSEKEKKQCALVIAALKNATSSLNSVDWSAVWKKLALISCWADGWASGGANELARLFPAVPIQGKGLLATEGFVTLPWESSSSIKAYNTDKSPLRPCLLSVNSHFFEFIDLDSQKPFLAHQLKPGAEYEVILSTGGGLYRYRLGDQVRCTSFVQSCPSLVFIGKTGIVSDICGEKLNSLHVEKVLAKTASRLTRNGQNPFLVPCFRTKPPRYFLVLPSQGGSDTPSRIDRKLLAAEVDSKLRENFHYDFCREFGQLGELGIVVLETGQEDGPDYLSTRLLRSNTKQSYLELNPQWQELVIKEAARC